MKVRKAAESQKPKSAPKLVPALSVRSRGRPSLLDKSESLKARSSKSSDKKDTKLKKPKTVVSKDTASKP